MAVRAEFYRRTFQKNDHLLKILSYIEQKFDQPDYKVYAAMESILIKHKQA